ncbi:cullin-9-like isoform X2 [Clavelina lepadiformis]|uniref:cullin-9-like isoform X2 n=1 Tax=Clavelina lepadiformis TaxID=159417 RepID=UPI0040422967
MGKNRQQKISLNIQETLEAKELLRQRFKRDGSVEHLVRWCICGLEKKSSSASPEVETSSTSLSDDLKTGKDVFLWMTNSELLASCPHLYSSSVGLENTGDQSARTKNESENDDKHLETSSDAEDFDDMKHDVVKLVNRAKKQMLRLKKESAPKALVTLSHTTKVLSTYAGLGSLAGIFRETGALDLILELLWTNDVETRRAAGRMLRALALHDAGSRAYVLLKLTQDESDKEGNDHMSHYADFENRSMVMEMFAETASGEEAHAVALDSVQLPQVPGKILFTLMKCYLRVTSLMDASSGKKSAQNTQRCMWMWLDEHHLNDNVIQEFEVAMVISDLIYELNQVMDWKNTSTTSTDSDGKKGMTPSPSHDNSFLMMWKDIRTSEKKSSKTTMDMDTCKQMLTDKSNSDGQVANSSSPKPLFVQSAQENSVDPVLLATLLRADKPQSIYKHPSSFSSRKQYCQYLRALIKPGYRVRACQSYQDVNDGDEGIYRQHNESTPPVQVFWHRLNRPYWVHWHHIVLLGSSSSDSGSSVSQTPPKFISNPEDSILWPLLSGMKSRVKPLYGISQHVTDQSNNKPNEEISQQDWWMILFYANKVSEERREVIKNHLEKSFPNEKHMCLIKPSMKDTVAVMTEILKEANPQKKKAMYASGACRRLIDMIEDGEKKEREETEKIEEDETKEGQPAILQSVKSDEKTLDKQDPDKLQSNKSSIDDKSVKEEDEINVTPEERSKAVEMGLRIGLIFDEDTEKKYLKMFMDDSNYTLASRLWKMQKESDGVVRIAKTVPEANNDGKVIALTILHNALTRSDWGIPHSVNNLKDTLGYILVAAEDKEKTVVMAYILLISACLEKDSKKTDSLDEPDSMELSLATSGHLKAIFDSIVRFQDDQTIICGAIHCVSKIMGAELFAKNPRFDKDRSSQASIVTAIITSIMAATDPDQPSTSSDKVGLTSSNSILRTLLGAVDDSITKLSSTDQLETFEKKLLILLYNALCVLCMIARKDQSKALMNMSDRVLAVIEKGLKSERFSPTKCQRIRQLMQRLKGFTMSSKIDEDMASESGNKGKDSPTEDDLLIDQFSLHDIKKNMDEIFDTHLERIRNDSSEIRSSTNTLVVDVVLPIIKNLTTVTDESGKCLSSLQGFVSEFKAIAHDHGLVLFECYWSELVMCLHHVIDLCILSSSKRLAQEVAGHAISILHTLSELDKDFAVELCGMEAKQTINRLLEKHESVPNAAELKDLITSCERHRALHSKLLAVVLGGCISTALRCIEDARQLQASLNIPLFDQLLSNLCKGADMEIKEEKCWEKLEVSTNQRHLPKLTDNNPKTYWESNGSSGAHWINVYMKKGVIVRKMTIVVAQEDSSYMPSRIAVLGGNTSTDITTQLSCVNIASTDREVVVLENARRYWPVIRISIRRCQQGGIDTRVHGLDVVGPKPSFWPILRRQLYVRTTLVYAVQAHSWAFNAGKTAGQVDGENVTRHKILDVPTKIVEAIRYEQQFSDRFLPNSESALILGQACRLALSAPVLDILLDKNQENDDTMSLMEQLLLAYLKCNEVDNGDLQGRIFSSKLRRLLRLLVDLDQGGSSSSSPHPSSTKSSKKPQLEHMSLWSKKVQPLSARSTDSVRVKPSSSDNSFSTRTEAMKILPTETVNSSAPLADEDCYQSSSHLPQVAEEWVKIVQQKFSEIIGTVVQDCDEGVDFKQFINAAAVILKKFEYLRKCTEDLFGSKAHFLLMFSAGVWKAVTLLDMRSATKFCYICIYLIRLFIDIQSQPQMTNSNEFKNLELLVKQVVRILPLISGTEVCYTFEHIYVTMLSMRLQYNQNLAFDLEQKMSQQLQVCFPNRRPIALLQDYAFSNQLHKRFVSSYLERCDAAVADVEDPSYTELWQDYNFLADDGFKVALCRPVVWCHYNSNLLSGGIEKQMSVLSERCFNFMSQFESFFHRDRINNSSCLFLNGNSSVHWTGSGYAVLRDLANDVELTVTTTQLLFLLHFNHQSEVHLKKWKEFYPCHDDDTLEQLVSKKIIYESSKNVFRVVEVLHESVDCVSAQDKVLTSMRLSSLSMENHSHSRNCRIDLVIHALMREEKEICGDLLIERVIKKFMTCHDSELQKPAEITTPTNHLYQFIPQAREVRSRCDYLIARGYLVQQDAQPQMLHYKSNDRKKSVDVKTGSDCFQSSNNNSSAIDESHSMSEVSTSLSKDAVLSTESSMVKIQVKPSCTSETTSSKQLLKSFSTEPEPILAPKEDPKPDCNSDDEMHQIVHFPCATISRTTLTIEKQLLEIKHKIMTLSDILSHNEDVAEALLLEFDWNADKLVEAFLNNRAETLQRIGVTVAIEDQESQKESLKPISSEDVASTSSSDDHCPICLNPMDPDNFVPLCGHKSCNNCWKTYLSLKLTQDSTCSATCPHNACHFRPTTRVYEKIFSDSADMRKKYNTALVRSYVESDRDVSWCHNPKGCDRIIRKANDGREEGWCSKCGWQTCFTCTYVEAHYPASCSHMSQWMDDGGYYEGMNEDAKSKHLARLIAKRCPNCQANIEKNDGCLHMKCAKCSHDFCWRCLQPWRPTHRDYYNCSSKVSKLAQDSMKFVEFNKRCQFHNRAKQFAYDIRDRLLAINNPNHNLHQLKFAVDICMKLVQCRKILAYSNVLSFYSVDSNKMRSTELHSAALETKTLQLQEHLSLCLLDCADIRHKLSSMTDDMMTKGEQLMRGCDEQIKIIVEFSKQGMKIGTPLEIGHKVLTEAGTSVLVSDFDSDGIVLNARLAGMSDEEDEDVDDDDNIEDDTSEHTQSDNEHDDSDDTGDNLVGMYSSDEDDEPAMYDSDNALGMDRYSFDDDNMDSLDSVDAWLP